MLPVDAELPSTSGHVPGARDGGRIGGPEAQSRRRIAIRIGDVRIKAFLSQEVGAPIPKGGLPGKLAMVITQGTSMDVFQAEPGVTRAERAIARCLTDIDHTTITSNPGGGGVSA
jgi:hypothetical protein